MKRLVYVFMIIALLCTVMTITSVSAFAEDVSDEVVEGVGDVEADKTTDAPVEDKKEPTIQEQIAGLKDKLFGYIKRVWNFIMSDETYKNIFTAVVAVLAFLMLPVIVALVVIAYVSLAAITMVSAALISVIEMLMSIVSKYVPM